MSFFPDILAVHRSADPHVVVLDLRVVSTLAFFRGHFPGFPILPGVVQVNWALHFAKEYLGVLPARFTGMKALKFTAPVLPDSAMTLELRLKSDMQRLEFAFFNADKKYSSGQIILARTVL